MLVPIEWEHEKKKKLSMLFSTNLSTCTAVVSPPCQGKVAGADHTHCGPWVWDPNGGFGSQRSPINTFLQSILEQRKN